MAARNSLLAAPPYQVDQALKTLGERRDLTMACGDFGCYANAANHGNAGSIDLV